MISDRPSEGRPLEPFESFAVLGVGEEASRRIDALVLQVPDHLQHLGHEIRLSLQTALRVEQDELRCDGV